jgi:AbrB family looped-hinge helix DNA binding protein
MQIATLTSQNQITIPHELRKLMGLQSGDKIRFVLNSRQEVIVKKVGGIRTTQGVFKDYIPKTGTKKEGVWLERNKKNS